MALDPGRIPALVPGHVRGILERLWSAGHAGFVVGGSLRDAMLGRDPADWDVATDARPERLLELFPHSHYENRFGTVLVGSDRVVVEVTTFRLDHTYADHRRPDSVTFSDTIEDDVARRDFTVNALAWGRDAGPAGTGEDPFASARFVDGWGGLDDLRRRAIRAVGDPTRRFDEDALRLLRAVRLAGQLEFEIDPATLAAIREQAVLVEYVSRERVGQELRRLLRGARPSTGLGLMADTGLLGHVLPELAAQRGLPQNKVPGRDCWDHTLATVDASTLLAPANERVVMASLFHDVGKPVTLSDGHFIGHDTIGAEMTAGILRRLAIPHAEADPVVQLVRLHMFRYEPGWSDAAVRRFIQRVGLDLLDDLMLLRTADNIGSGMPGRIDPNAELRRRIDGQLAAGIPLGLSDLAVDGDDLQRELGLEPGPIIGRILDRLLESVVADPARNTRRQSIVDARGWLPELLGTGAPTGAPRQRTEDERGPTSDGAREAGSAKPAGTDPDSAANEPPVRRPKGEDGPTSDGAREADSAKPAGTDPDCVASVPPIRRPKDERGPTSDGAREAGSAKPAGTDPDSEANKGRRPP